VGVGLFCVRETVGVPGLALSQRAFQLLTATTLAVTSPPAEDVLVDDRQNADVYATQQSMIGHHWASLFLGSVKDNGGRLAPLPQDPLDPSRSQTRTESEREIRPHASVREADPPPFFLWAPRAALSLENRSGTDPISIGAGSSAGRHRPADASDRWIGGALGRARRFSLGGAAHSER